MSTVVIQPKRLRGTVTPPPSKSQAHRLIIAAALSDGVCRLSNVELSQDIQATLDFIYWCVTSETGTQAMGGGEGARRRSGRSTAPLRLRRVGLHPALCDPPCPHPDGRGGVYRTGQADGAPPDALFPTVPGEGDLL